MNTLHLLARLIVQMLYGPVIALVLFFMPTAIQAQDPSLVGQYVGLAARTGETPVWTNSHLGGRLEMTAAASGNFSGKLIYSGTTLSFTGAIESTDVGSGTSTVLISRGSLPALTLDLFFSEDLVSGILSHPDGESVSVSGWRKIWNATTRAATSFMGRHHFHLRTDLSEVGNGFGSFTVASDGDLTVNGELPDGNKFKTSSFVGPNGQVLVYQVLHSKPGSLLGIMTISGTSEDSASVVSSSDFGITWYKPLQTSTKDRFFREGFTTSCQPSGGLYKAPAPGDIAAGLLDVTSNGYLYFSGLAENSETPAGAFFTLNTSGKVKMSTGTFNRAKTTLTVKPTTGEYYGGFTLVDYDYNNQTGTDKLGNPIYKKLTRKVKYRGLIVDDGKTAVSSGYYYTASTPDNWAEPPTTLSTSPLTGGVASIQPNTEAPTPLVVGFSEASYALTEGEVVMVTLLSESEMEDNRTFTVKVVPGTATSADLSATLVKVTIPGGQRSASFEVPVKDDGLDEDDEVFSLILTDGAGFDLSETADVEVTISDDDYGVDITGDPPSVLVGLGELYEFKVEADGSDMKYQWQRQGVAIAGAVTNPWVKTSVQFSDAGIYTVKVSNSINEDTSEEFEVAVVDTSSKLVAQAPNSTVTLSAGVAGPPGSLTYQWQVSGSDVEDDTSPAQRITGAQTPTLIIKNVGDEDIGNYVCLVTQASSLSQLSTGFFYLRLPSAPPVLENLELSVGQVLRPYFHETIYDTAFEFAPGSFSATGLPPGLQIDPNTGIISGTPTTPVNNARVVVSAVNPRGTTSVEGFLTIQAFPEAGLGTFQGLVDRHKVDGDFGPVNTWLRSDLGARFEITTTATGSFSGKIINGSTQNFSGTLQSVDEDWLTATTTVPQGEKGLPPLTFRFSIYLPEQTLSGELFQSEQLVNLGLQQPAYVWGWRNAWSKTNPAKDYVGRFNFTLGDGGSPSILEMPAGRGFGTFQVPDSGTFNVTGKLPDGTAFICNTFLGPKGQVLLYQPIYKNPGSFHGAIQAVKPYDDSGEFPLSPFEKGPLYIARLPLNSASGEELNCTWNKPFQTDLKDKTYRRGFTVGSLSVDGGVYTPPESGQVVMDLPEVLMNAQIQFAEDDSGFQVLPTGFTIPSSGKPVIPTGIDNPLKLTFTLNAETGQFNGAFTRRDEDPDRPPLYSETTGKLIRAQGYFTRQARFYGIIAYNSAFGVQSGIGYYTIPQLPNAEADPAVTEGNAQNLTLGLNLSRNDNAEEPLIIGFGGGGGYLSMSEGDGEMQAFVSMSQYSSTRRTVALSLQHLTSSGADVTLSKSSVVFEPGETEASFSISITQDDLDEIDEYLYVKLADGPGYDLGARRIALTIMDDDEAVQITEAPASVVMMTGGAGASFGVMASGSEPRSYQWRLNGVPIPGATGTEYQVYPGQMSDGGRYDVVVSNRVNSLVSDPADLAMLDSRERTFPVAAGATANVALNIAAPAGSVTYQWSRVPNGPALIDDGRITGSNSRVLTVRGVTSDDEGEYYCTVRSVDSSIDWLIEGVSPMHRLVIVTDAPSLMEIPDQLGNVARPFYYQVEFQMDSYRYPASFSATNLPAGLVIDPVSGAISGSPSVAVVDHSFSVTASNAAGSATVSGLITVEALPASTVGTFHGLVSRLVGYEDFSVPGEFHSPWPDAELGGLFELTTLPSGSFSGKLTYAGNANHFTGSLVINDGGEVLANTLIQRTDKPMLFLSFNISLDSDALIGSVSNTLSGGGEMAAVTAWRQVWSTANPATAYAGIYNFSIATVEGGNERSPGGYGYATCAIPMNGAAFDIKGRLPDGKPFVCSSRLGPQGQLIVHQTQYARLGSVLSQLSLNAPPDGEADGPSFVEVSGESTLFKPRQTASTELIYKAGIGPVSLNFEGGRYVEPAADEVVMGVDDVIDNASISIFGAGADYSETQPSTIFRIRAGGTSVMKTSMDDNPAKINVTEIKPSLGEFKGNFTLTDTNPSSLTTKISRSSDFFGLFVQLPSGETVGRGYFTLKQLPDPYATPPTTSATAPSYTGMVDILRGPGPSF